MYILSTVYGYESLYNSAVGARLGNSIVRFGLCTYLVFKHFSSGGYSEEIMYQEVTQSVGDTAQEI